MKEKVFLYSKKEDCCGCSACFAICPQRAICMKEDREGFEYPEIDEENCQFFICTGKRHLKYPHNSRTKNGRGWHA